MARVERLQKLIYALRDRAAKANREASVIVGYTQSYAVYVHEDLEVYHKVGQAKFLEQPFRELAGELKRIVFLAVKRGQTMSNALLLAGLRLQRESQRRVPVDTGALKNSAFTKLEV